MASKTPLTRNDSKRLLAYMPMLAKRAMDTPGVDETLGTPEAIGLVFKVVDVVGSSAGDVD